MGSFGKIFKQERGRGERKKKRKKQERDMIIFVVEKTNLPLKGWQATRVGRPVRRLVQ